MALNCFGNCRNCSILTDNALFELAFESIDLRKFVLGNAGCGNTRPKLNNICDFFLGKSNLFGFGFNCGKAFGKLELFSAHVCNLLVTALLYGIVACNFIFERFPLLFEVKELVANAIGFVDNGRRKRESRSGFVEKVDGFIGQITVGNITLGKHNGTAQHVFGHNNTVKFLIIVLDAAQHLHCFVNRRFIDGYGLETTFESRILFDILAIFVKCGSTNDLHLAARECGLEDVCRIDTSLGITGTNNVVYLVDDKNRIADSGNFSQKSKNTGFKLSAELRSCNKGGHIQQINLFALQFVRNVTCGNANSKCFGNSRFTDTGFTNEAWIVLLSAAKNLNNT